MLGSRDLKFGRKKVLVARMHFLLLMLKLPEFGCYMVFEKVTVCTLGFRLSF